MAYQQQVEKGNDIPTGPIGGAADEPGVFPLDIHNAKLLDQVAPKDWTNPDRGDDFVYDMISIGAGAGGLVSAKQGARRGGKTALIEKHLAGGDCLNVGCVPSKALLRAARAIREAKNQEAADMGVILAGAGPSSKKRRVGDDASTANTVEVDFGAIMSRLRRLRARIAPADSYQGATNLGVDVYQGHAKFTGKNTLEVGGKTLKFKKAVVATGGRATAPPIKGLKGTPYTTNATLYNLNELPKRMIVIGAGPIGSEMAQAFATFGTEVTVLASQFLPREDPDAVEIIRAAMEKDGVQFSIGCNVQKVEHENGIFKVYTCAHEGETEQRMFEAEVCLVAAGRAPNVEGIGLEAAGVEYTRRGVTVDEFMQTSNPDIFAVGDVCSVYQFTHMSGTMGSMVVDNAIFGEKRSVKDLVVPWATFTEPEVAHVGKYEHEVEGGCDTYKASLEHNDRAILEGTDEGFFKIHCKKGTDTIVGGTIVAAHAGEMLSELTLCVQFGIPLGRSGLGSVIHAYPTVADGMGGCAFGYKMKHWKTIKDGKIVGGEPEPEKR